MEHTSPLMQFNLHIHNDHLDQLTRLATAISKRKGCDTRLAEALELALVAGLSWTDQDLLDLLKPDREARHLCAPGPIVRAR
jgi:hypothetical protein